MGEVARTPTVVRVPSGDRLFAKLGRFARVAGRVVVERALRLYYAAQDPLTPPWAKRVIYAALAYFIVPLDLIPDFVPGVGYLDDLGSLTVALLLVSAYVSPAVKKQAREKTMQWFG
jgi:uncharacterized membrane protein YkvA (DUF1232 family)